MLLILLLFCSPTSWSRAPTVCAFSALLSSEGWTRSRQILRSGLVRAIAHQLCHLNVRWSRDGIDHVICNIFGLKGFDVLVYFGCKGIVISKACIRELCVSY